MPRNLEARAEEFIPTDQVLLRVVPNQKDVDQAPANVVFAAERFASKGVELAPGLVINQIPKWDMAAELNRLYKDINRGLNEGKTLFESVVSSTKTLEMHVRGYDREVIKSKVVLPHINKFALKDGQLRMVGSNGEPIVNSISAQERNGFVLEASIAIENSLVSAEKNTFRVLMSPSGWNGFTDEYSQDALPHLNTQAMIFWKDQEGDLKGLTLHIDLKRDQAKRVMQSLGVSYHGPETKSEKDEIVDIVRNPASLSLPRAYANPFEYVLDKILAQRGKHAFRLLQLDGTEEIRPVEEVRADIKRLDELLEGNEKEEEHIGELIDLILKGFENVGQKQFQQQIIYKIERTIIDLATAYLTDIGEIPISQSARAEMPVRVYERYSDYDRVLSREEEDQRARAFLETRAGCPISIAAMSGKGSRVAGRAGSIFDPEKPFYKPGFCKNCKQPREKVGRCDICESCASQMSE